MEQGLEMREEREENYAEDGSLDLKLKNPVLRSRTGGWTACSFLIVYELIERMAYYGIASNLVLYLINELHEGTVEAANTVTNWTGTVFLTPIIGAYVADAYLGRYWTFVVGSVIYLLGMCLLTLAVSIPKIKLQSCKTNCTKASSLQLGIFFAGLYIIAVGNGGTKPNISTFGADQFDEFHQKEKIQKLSFFNWWMFGIFVGTLFAPTVLVYLQDNVGWSIGYGVSTIALVVSVLVFLVGTPFYRHKIPQGSPFTKMTRVLVASLRKWRLKHPSDKKELHELDFDVLEREKKSKIESTKSMRFLDKAAIKCDSDTKWTLCSVTEIEETKQMIRTLPILISLFLPCTMIAQINTLFVKQGTTLDRHLGPTFQIPAASLSAFVTLSMLVSVVIYDRYFVKIARNLTQDPRGVTILQRIGIGMFFQVMTMVIASLSEMKRLSTVRKGGDISLSIFFLLPQFVLMGFADSFLTVGLMEFFYDQAPNSMKSLGSSYSLTAYGVGNFLSSFLLTLVSKITSERGKGWVLNDLNKSRLDYYYAFLTVLNALNFLFFLVVSVLYNYKVESFGTSDEIKEDEKNGHSELKV
ncbi:hypothetical protein LUZ60_014962 [Juncus effusus]|nr:hypothetical protein LUZ60_014962 [Juncus effusus]